VIRRLAAGVCGALLLTLTASGVVAAHEFNPPNGGNGDTPLNSPQAIDNALDHFLNAVAQGQAENALLRNPTCAFHDIHPPGNP
jgi:hypothetical protein